jgi:hypothetical protein
MGFQRNSNSGLKPYPKDKQRTHFRGGITWNTTCGSRLPYRGSRASAYLRGAAWGVDAFPNIFCISHMRKVSLQA